MVPHLVFLIRGLSLRDGDVDVVFLQCKVLSVRDIHYPVNPPNEFPTDAVVPSSDHCYTETVLPSSDDYCIGIVMPPSDHCYIETVPPSSDHYCTKKVAPRNDYLHPKIT